MLSATHKQRVKREASPSAAAAEQKLYFNISAFGKEFHLRLQPNQQLVAPGAMVEWHDQVWEPLANHTDGGTSAANASSAGDRAEPPSGSERILRRELLQTDCTFVGDITDVPGASVAINNCDGLVSSTPYYCSTLVWSFGPLLKSLVLDLEVFLRWLSSVLDGLGICIQDQRRLGQHCNDTIIQQLLYYTLLVTLRVSLASSSFIFQFYKAKMFF